MFYRLKGDTENFRNYVLPKGMSAMECVTISESYDGRSHKALYNPPFLEMTLESEKRFPVADFQDTQVAICSEKAKKVIEEICDENEVEFFPCGLEGVDEMYYIMNILGAEDCVDYDNSKFTRFASSGKIMFFEHIAFKSKVKRHFLRIKDLPYGFYFVSQEVKDKLEQAELEGVVFDDKLFSKEK